MQKRLRRTVRLLAGIVIVAGVLFIGRYSLYRFVRRPRETLARAGADWLGPLDSTWRRLSCGSSYAIQRVSEPGFEGSDALRFETRKGDAWINENGPSYRAEIETYDRAPINSVRWYRFSLLFPRDFPIEDNRLVVFQWHGSDKTYLGEPSRSPTLAFRFRQGCLFVTLRHSSERIVRDPDRAPSEMLWRLPDLPLGKWHDFVVQAKWSYQMDGFVNIWWNGRQVAHYRGPASYNDDSGPYVQFGLYRDASDQTYVSYVSNVRGGWTAGDVGFAEPNP